MNGVLPSLPHMPWWGAYGQLVLSSQTTYPLFMMHSIPERH